MDREKNKFLELSDELRRLLGGQSRATHPRQILSENHQDVFKIQTILNLTNRAVITGAPGSGKTTILRYFAWVTATSLLTDDNEVAEKRLEIKTTIPVPIIIPLNAYAKYIKDVRASKDPEAGTLLSFISNYLLYRQAALNLPPNFFEILATGNHCLLLLDGLDEIPTEDERLLISSAIQDFSFAFNQTRIIVTCRESAYKGSVVLPAQFREVRIKELDMDTANALVTKLYEAIYPHDIDERKRRIGDLQGELKSMELRKRHFSSKLLINSPLLARMMVVVHYNKQSLPNQRAELYRDCIEMMLKPLYHPDREVAIRILNQTGLPLADQIALYSSLAFEMHIRGKNKGRNISEQDVLSIFKNSLSTRYGPEKAFEMAERLVILSKERSGLLEYSSRSFQFVHLGFQEFLTARYIAEKKRIPSKIIEFFSEQSAFTDPWWREPILLVAGYLSYIDPETADDYILALASISEQQPLTMKATLLELAGDACLEWQEDSLIRGKIRDTLRSFLFDEIEIKDLPVVFRANLGIIYSALTDNRLDVLLKIPLTVPVPGGKYTIGYYDDGFKFKSVDSLRKEGKFSIDVSDFYIGKYPITNYQFSFFISDNGYHDQSLWTEEGWEWKNSLGIHEPVYWNEPLWNDPSCPVVGISWYEAVAYCQWLTRCTGRNYRLPTEVEWEVSARGTRESDWPWGDDPRQVKCNTVESGIGRTTIVGLFFEDQSEFGINDLAGNVWEWCGSIYLDYPYRDDDGREELRRSGPRCLRGGSWLNDIDHAHSANRDRYHPGERNYDLGFRVVLENHSTTLAKE